MSDTQVTTLDDPKDTTAATTPKRGAKAAEAKAAPVPGTNLSGERKTITIHQGDGAAGREDVNLFYEGVAFQIKRGKPVDVPVEIIDGLRNAVYTHYEGGEVIETPRFAFTVHN